MCVCKCFSLVSAGAPRHVPALPAWGKGRVVQRRVMLVLLEGSRPISAGKIHVARPFRNRELGPWAFFAKNEAS